VVTESRPVVRHPRSQTEMITQPHIRAERLFDVVIVPFELWTLVLALYTPPKSLST